MEGFQARSSSKEPGVRNESRDHGGKFLTDFLSVDCFACFLIQPEIICPGMALPTVDWDINH